MGPQERQSLFTESLPPGSEVRQRWDAHLHPRRTHGGPAARGRRKGGRPFFPGVPQMVLLSSQRARGPWNLAHRRHRSRITGQAYTYARRFRVRVLGLRIVPGQIQLLVRAGDRKDLADFFRVFAGRVAISVTGARKRVKRTGKFWNELFFSRLLRWGAEFQEMRERLFSGPPSFVAWEAHSVILADRGG